MTQSVSFEVGDSVIELEDRDGLWFCQSRQKNGNGSITTCRNTFNEAWEWASSYARLDAIQALNEQHPEIPTE